MSVVQCPNQGCGFTSTQADRTDLIKHRRSCHVAPIAKPGPRKKKPTAKQKAKANKPDMAVLRRQTAQRANGRCEAHGLHHSACPQSIDNAPETEFAAHHVQPREYNGPDTLDNLIWVWNGTGLGAGGCHANLHTHSRVARTLGLLKTQADDPHYGIGVDAGLRLGFLQPDQIKAAAA